MRRSHFPGFGLPAITVLALIGPASAVAQTTRIGGFTDVRARTNSRWEAAGFSLGQFDLFITSRLGEKIDFLAETVFESNGDAFQADVERLIASYAASGHLIVSAGRLHTPIGYWNNGYHHGALVQPTIDRPQLFRFEDDGGVLPVHSVGLQVSGRELGAARLGFEVMVANGVGGSPLGDNNAAKAVIASVHVQPVSALRVGLSYYGDRLAAGTPTPRGDSLAADSRLAIGGGFVHLERGRVELLGELQRGATSATAQRHGAWMWTGYAGVALGPITPYVRWDGIAPDAGDRYFARDDLRVVVAGGRYDLAATAVIKLEWQTRTTGGPTRVSRLAAQFAVGF